MAVLQTGLAKSLAEAYTIDQSLRFNTADSSYLSWTPGSAGDLRSWTISLWAKRCTPAQSTNPKLYDTGNGWFNFQTTDSTFYFGEEGSSELQTSASYRDPGSWYHIIVVWDSDNVTEGDRYRLYVNGDRVTDFQTESYPARYTDSKWNSATQHDICSRISSRTDTTPNAYLAEFYFIDGQALDADSFGETDTTTNQWKPIDASDLTFGTNGFYQKYAATELADSFADSAEGHTIVVNGNTHTDTSIKKIGTASAQFDGTGDDLQITGTPIGSGTGDWTVEFWFYKTTDTTVKYFWDMRNSTYPHGGSPSAPYMQFNADADGVTEVLSGLSNGSSNLSSGTVDLLNDTWHHVASVRDSGTLYLYLNGTSVANTADTGTLTASTDWRIGGRYSDADYYTGYIDEFRVSDNARYPDGTTFTPSTTEFENDSNTKLLMHMDGANDGTVFTDSSTVARHTITANGDVANTRAVGNFQADYLVVAGGGGGGVHSSEGGCGGGGAGGMLTGTFSLFVDKAYTVTVGDGGTATATGVDSNGNSGGDSSVGGITSIGGGGGGARGVAGTTGGSAGGDGARINTRTAGTAGQGNAGGSAQPSGSGWDAGGGGGGKGAVGADAHNITSAGAGGTGTASSITGASVTYAGGGGGSVHSGTAAGAGGSGGGGRGGDGSSTSVSGTANTGGGGGGCGSDLVGAGGGSGIVVIRYESATNLATGGTITTDGDFKVHTFTSSGTFTPTANNVAPGTSSIAFDGTGDYLSSLGSSSLAPGSGDFTYECWFYQTGAGHTYPTLWTTSSSTSDAGGIRVSTGDGNRELQIAGGSGAIVTSDTIFAADTWHHMAVVRDSGTLSLYLNGASVGSASNSTDFSTDDFYGGSIATSYYFAGYQDELRLSDTARYTGAFTPSTTEFTADANTMLLIHSDWDGGLGADSSGNYNTFTPTNLVATDKMVDSPTNNFSTLNPLNGNLSDGTYFSEGNLESYDGAGWAGSSTIQPESGKWYAEFLVQSTSAGSGANESVVGIVFDSWLEAHRGEYPGSQTDQYGYYRSGQKVHNGSFSSYGDAYVAGDIIGVALDLTNDNLYFSKNNAWQNSGDPTSGATGTGALSLVADKQWAFALGTAGGAARTDWNSNFGADSSFAGNKTSQGNQDGNGIGDFYYEPPSGYLALCTSNLPDPEIKLPGDNFDAQIWTGTGDGSSSGGKQISTDFAPDFVWIKPRSDADPNNLFDVTRGANETLKSNLANAELTIYDAMDSFDSDGYTLGFDPGGFVNYTGRTYVGWSWKGGGTPTADNSAGAGATPTAGSVKIDGSNLGSALAGSIAATRLSANTTNGFSIISYTGVNPLDPATVAHGLSQKPELVIIKRTDAGTNWWIVGSDELTSWDYYMGLNATDAQASGGYFESTAPTASVIELRNDGDASVNGNGNTYVAYAFHSVEGYSKVGSYTGNGNADGPFVYTGFRPAYVLFKRISGAVGTWCLKDDARSPYNPAEAFLSPDRNAVESDEANVDFVSNGFKLRTTEGAMNAANPILYLAFAQSPFKYANAR